MKLNNISQLPLLIFLFVALIAVDSKKFVTQKKQESLISKLESVHQRNVAIRNYRSTGNRNDKHPNNSPNMQRQLLTQDDEDIFEAIIMRTFLIRLLHIVEKSLKVSSHGLRLLGDTSAGLLSSLMRGIGGVMNIFATLINKISYRVDHSIPKDPMGKALVLGDSRMNLVTTLNNVAKLVSGVSHACIWGGEITESLTLGLGEAVQDSFRGLELITRAGNRAINFIFLNDYLSDEHSDQPHDNSISVTFNPNKTAHSLSHTINHMPDLVISEEDLRNEQIVHENPDFSQDKSDILAKEVQAELAQLKKLGFTPSSSHSSSTTSKGSDANEMNRLTKNTDSTSSSSSEQSDFASRQNYHQKKQEEHSGSSSSFNMHHHSPFVRGLLRVVDMLDTLWHNSVLQYQTTVDFFTLKYRQVSSLPLFSRLHSSFVVDSSHQQHQQSVLQRYNIEETWLDRATFGMSTMTIQIALLFTVIWIFALIPFQSTSYKASLLFVLFAVTGMALIWMEYRQRQRLIQRTASIAVSSYLAQQVGGFAYHPTELVEDDKYIDRGHMQVVKITNQVYHNLSSTEQAQADNIAWANIMVSSLWTLYDAQTDIHGMGPYTNDVYKEMLTNELSNIPPGIANLRLKRFDLGTNPPFMKGIKGFTYRNHTCIRHLEESLSSTGGAGAAADGSYHQSHQSSHRKKGLAAKIAEWEKRFLRSSSAPNSKSARSAAGSANNPWSHLDEQYTSILDYMLDAFGPVSSSATSSSFASSQKKQRRHHQRAQQRANAKEGGRGDHDEQEEAADSEMMDIGEGWFDHFSIDCDRLYIDVDMVYASKDMDIVLSLRPSDLKSMVPEMAVTLSEVRFVGEVRFGIQLTEDYPFFGNATMSFTELPSFDFTLNSFGGLELTSIPLAFSFVNSSVHYMLEQYTYPHHTTLDLRHTICPKCDQQEAPSLPESIYSSTQFVALHMRQRLSEWRKNWQLLSQWCHRHVVQQVSHGWKWLRTKMKEQRHFYRQQATLSTQATNNLMKKKKNNPQQQQQQQQKHGKNVPVGDGHADDDEGGNHFTANSSNNIHSNDQKPTAGAGAATTATTSAASSTSKAKKASFWWTNNNHNRLHETEESAAAEEDE